MAKAYVSGLGCMEKQSLSVEVTKQGNYEITPEEGKVFVGVSLSVDGGNIVNTTGDSDLDAMSQKATTDAIDLLATSQKKCVFGGDFSGNNYGEFKCSIPAGTYNLHIDSVETSDTDATTSMILFVSNGATIKSRSLARNTPIDGEIVFSSSVDVIRIYASKDWSSGQGDTFSVNGLKIIEDTVLNERLSAIERKVETPTELIKNGLLRCVNADTVAWVNKTVYFGQYTDDPLVISTPQVFMLAGSTINFNHSDGRYLFRVTKFNLDKTYNSNTGTLSALDYYSVEENCYIAITMRDSTAPTFDLTIGDSTRVSFNGYTEVDFAALNRIDKMLEHKTMQPVDADTVRWSKTTVWLGSYNKDDFCISCDPFLMVAGSTITFSDKYKIRVTEFNLDKTYKSNTGSYVNMDSYTVGEDCYIAIGLNNTETPPDVSEGNSTNVVFNGYLTVGDLINRDADNVILDIRKNTFNNVYSDIEDVFTPALSAFALNAYSGGVVEPFMFFTDPHTFGADETHLDAFISIMSNIQRLYNNSVANFLVCGGDWFSYSRTSEELSVKLGYIKGVLQNMFKNAYTVVGNHEMYVDNTWAEHQPIANALYGGKKGYYSFDGANTKCYALDTGMDALSTMTAYRWEQIEWLAEQFKTEDAEHSLLFMHIYAHDAQDGFAANGVTTEHAHPFARNIVDLVSAYNSKSTITLNGKVYDFSDCVGKMHCIFSGHTHYDFNLVDNNVPVVGTYTAQTMVDGIPTFDMCVADYGTNKLYLTRIGYGSNRVIDLA